MASNINKGDKKDGGFRCSGCNRLLAKESLKREALEIKCVRCGTFNLIFRGCQEQVVITDAEGVIIYANSMMEKVTGYKLSEIVGGKPSLWGGQMPSSFYKKMWHRIKVKKEPILVKVTNKRRDGSFYDARLRISPVLDVDGDIKFFVGIETVLDPRRKINS